MIEIKRANEIEKGIREKISEIFVQGFGKDLRFFSKDYNILKKALAHIFVLDLFYIALANNEIAGIMACTNMKTFCIQHDKKTFIKHLGLIKGISADMVFKNYFQKYPKYPVETNEKTASVEFVATSEKYRGQGIASAIMRHLWTFPEYNEYILEVADTNIPAVKLYEKLGYKEIYRKKQKFSKYAGINYLIYMKYSKNIEELKF
ncbi:MAG: GNAT family N-acetyltransferase [Spirochaetales bacterium]|jgi:ribosomal protein S18 acetylase RimI-like enzyme|nr:GNAT family N-acetyltransferase [Spirochaetales bacterium]